MVATDGDGAEECAAKIESHDVDAKEGDQEGVVGQACDENANGF